MKNVTNVDIDNEIDMDNIDKDERHRPDIFTNENTNKPMMCCR